MLEVCEDLDDRLFARVCGQHKGASLAVLEGEM